MVPSLLTLTLLAFCVPLAAAGTNLRYTWNGYTLDFYDLSGTFSQTTQDRMVDAFFTVYPQERSTYNSAAPTYVKFTVDPNYKGVATTSGASTRFNPVWFVNHPDDIDTVTHECMHIAQAYKGTGLPGWAIEGIADYARNKFGVDNAAAGWSLGDYSSGQNYLNGYTVTARFLLWIEYWYYPDFVKEYDAALRGGTWSGFFERTLGATVDEIWADYASYPYME